MANKQRKSTLAVRRILLAAYPQNWLAAAAVFSAGYWLSGIHLSLFWFLGIIYFLSPYNLLLFAVNNNIPFARSPIKPDYFWRFVVATNVPFWIYFWFNQSLEANLVSVIVFGVILLLGTWKRHAQGLPGLDVVLAASMSTLPFLFGVWHAHVAGAWWVPIAFAIYLVALAIWVFYDLAMIAPDIYGHIKTFATKLGAEVSLVVCLSSYLVASVLPAFYYGWYGAPVSFVLLLFVVYVAQVLPFRANREHPIFAQTQWHMTKLGYSAGLALALYCVLLYLIVQR